MRQLNRAVTHTAIAGAWVASSFPTPRHPLRPNFVICCQYGDWSGFRTLAECLAQAPQAGRPDGFYWIEER